MVWGVLSYPLVWCWAWYLYVFWVWSAHYNNSRLLSLKLNKQYVNIVDIQFMNGWRTTLAQHSFEHFPNWLLIQSNGSLMIAMFREKSFFAWYSRYSSNIEDMNIALDISLFLMNTSIMRYNADYAELCRTQRVSERSGYL